jgi:RHS repeat-associated protein
VGEERQQTGFVAFERLDTANPATVDDTSSGVESEYSYSDLAYPNQATEVENVSSGTEISVVSNVYDGDGETCLTGTALAGQRLWDLGTHTCAWQSNYTFTRYNQDGNPIIVEDPVGNETTYAYDDALLPTLVTKSANAIGVGSTYTYDLDGQLLDATDSAQNTTSYAYDPDGNLCWKSPTFASSDCGSPPSGVGVTSYAYDRRTAMTTNTSSGTSLTDYDYDANSDVTSVGPSTAVYGDNNVSYLYDYSGDVECMAYPYSSGSSCGTLAAPGTPSSTNPIVDKTFNDDGQVTGVTDWETNTTGISYNGAGLNEGTVYVVTYPTSTPETVTYGSNDDDQVTSTNFGSGVSGTTNGSFTYSDGLMSTSARSSLVATSSSAVTYTPKDQVTTDGPSATFSYGSDSTAPAVNNEGELLTSTSGTTTTTNSYNTGEELISSVTGLTTTTYGYDQNGSRCWSSTTSTTGSCASPPSGASTYTWNAFHQLTASSYDATSSTYAYNGDGLRSSDTIGATTENFGWDEVSDPSQPLLLEDSNYAYIYGASATPIEEIALSGGTTNYLVTDPGGVRYVFGSGSTLVETLKYSTFGVSTVTGSSVSAFGFQGAYTDSDGLLYLIDRYYDPSTDQFLSVDPFVTQTGQPYAFTGNDPLNATDPDGTGPTCGNQPGACVQITNGHPETVDAPPPITTSASSSPYQGPGINYAGPTKVVYVELGVVTISTELSVTGRDTHPKLALDSDGGYDLSSGGTSVHVSPNGDVDGEIPILEARGISFCTVDGGGFCYQSPPVTIDLGLEGRATVTTTITYKPDPSPGFPWENLIKGLGLAVGAVTTFCGANAIVCVIIASPTGA